MHRMRRRVAVVALALPLLPVPTVASAADAADPAVAGSYGQPDEFAAVVNQSLALMAFAGAGEDPAQDAVTWLLTQQCADGAFVAFRSDVGEPCAEPDPATFTGTDTNSTAYAAMALASVGEADAATSAVEWLRGVQEADGGWAFIPGAGSDANSTGLVLSAFAATGTPPPAGGAEALVGFGLGCEADEAVRGAFTTPFDPPGTANALATAQSVPGAAGAFYPVPPQDQAADVPALACPVDAVSAADAAAAGAGWLAQQVAENSGFVPQDPAFGEGPDVAVTAESIMAMVAVGCCSAETETAVAWLVDNAEGFLSPEGTDSAGALGKVALALEAADQQADLVDELLQRIEATQLPAQPAEADAQTPAATASPQSEPAPSPQAAAEEQTGPAATTWWLVAAGVLLLAAAGWFLVRRRGRPTGVDDSSAGPDSGSGPGSSGSGTG